MIYNQPLSYGEPNFSYIGNLYIYVPGKSNPIIVSNVSVFYTLNQDYSNLTTISVLSVEIQNNAIITVIPEGEDYSALLTAEVIYITGENEIAVD